MKFDNLKFQMLCKNFNVRIWTTVPQTPWNNSLIKKHNAIPGLIVTKTMEDIKCDLQLVVLSC